MSYDLFFKPNDMLADVRIEAYFFGRPGYELHPRQAWYSNDDTGVYFSFEWGDAGEDVEDEEDVEPYAAAFNLNFVRPDFFALEAEPELRAFVEYFGAETVDGPFDSERFLADWRTGNRFGVRSVASEHGAAAFMTLPGAELERIWRWNRGRRDLQAQLGDGFFVPRIMLFDVDGSVRSAVVWTDAMPVDLPKVDLVVLARDKLAPRRRLVRRPDMLLAPWDDLREVLGVFEHREGDGQAHWRLEYTDAVPAALRTWLTSRSGGTSALAHGLVSMDRVVAAEEVDGAG